MDRPFGRQETGAALAALLGVLGAVAAALGVFGRGDGEYVTVTSARGEVYEMATSGVYAFNARPLVAEGVGWDVFTLVVVAPLLLAAAPFVSDLSSVRTAGKIPSGCRQMSGSSPSRW